jgi:Zn-dependent protease/predicted transcriptional regulator
MKWSITIAKIFGIPVRLHLTFLGFLLFIAIMNAVRGGIHSATYGVLFIIAIFISVTIHEIGHSLVAQSYGIKVKDITLLPIGGVSRIERIPDDPKQELRIAVTGPLVSFGIALLLFIIIILIAGPKGISGFSFVGGRFLPNLMWVNVLIGIFNILPGFPMDGGRVFRAILAQRMGYVKATKIAASVGQGFAILLGIVGLFFNIWLVFIAFFIYIGAGEEERMVQVRSLLRDIPVAKVMATNFQKLSPDDTLRKALEHIYHGFQEDFPVVSENKIVGILTKNEILSSLHKLGLDTKVTEVMKKDFIAVKPNQMLTEVYEQIKRCGCSSLPVVKGNELLGIITMEAIGQFFMFESAQQDYLAHLKK